MKLLTKEMCDQIVETSEAFYRADRVVEGVRVAIYDYRLASLSDFVDNNAFEIRGLTFIEQPDGSWKRNLLLNKFFNVNQTEGWMYDDVKDKRIERIQNKEDGSVISFCRFPNDNIRAKSKTSFESDQANMAQEIFMESPHNFRKFITLMLNIGHTPIFELVGYENQIVLNYSEAKELVLLQVRSYNGSYLSRSEIEGMALRWNLNVAEDFDNLSLDELLHIKETYQGNIEGWVVTFEDGQMAKIKTDHYLQLHGLIGPDAFRENLLIKTILDGNIDDVISALSPGKKKDSIIALDEKVVHNYNHMVVEFKELRRKYFNDFDANRKEFAIKYSKEPLFGSVMKTLNTSFRDVEQTAEKAVYEYITKQTAKLGDAKAWVEAL